MYLVCKEVLCQYINNGISVYACLLDASFNASDSVHYGKLFNITLLLTAIL